MSTPEACRAVRRRDRRTRPETRFVRPADTVAVLSRTVHVPRRNETIALLVDDARRGVAIVSVAGTHDADDVVEVVELLTLPTTHGSRAHAIVLASVWADAPPASPGRAVIDRWLELHHIAADHGVELLDWFEFSDRVTSLRVAAGAPSRW